MSFSPPRFKFTAAGAADSDAPGSPQTPRPGPHTEAMSRDNAGAAGPRAAASWSTDSDRTSLRKSPRLVRDADSSPGSRAAGRGEEGPGGKRLARERPRQGSLGCVQPFPTHGTRPYFRRLQGGDGGGERTARKGTLACFPRYCISMAVSVRRSCSASFSSAIRSFLATTCPFLSKCAGDVTGAHMLAQRVSGTSARHATHPPKSASPVL